MPTNRTRRTRRKAQSEEWMREFILTGKVLRPDGSESPRPFLWRAEFNGCFAHYMKTLSPEQINDIIQGR